MSWAESKWIVDSILRKMGQQPNNMRSFVATPLSNTSIGLTFLEPEDSYVEGNLLCSVGGVMVRYSTEDYPKTTSDGELAVVNKELGKYATTPFVLENLDEDSTYYFSAFPFSTQGVYNLSSSAVNRVKMAPANGEAVTVNINIDDDSAFSTVRVHCIDETDGAKTKVATLSPMKKTATFTVMTGHQYHVEFGEVKDYSQPTRTVSKVAEAGGTSEYTGNYEYFTSEIVTTYPKGSTVTCMKDTIKYTATDTSGSYTFKVHEVGTWTVTSTDGNQTSTRTVNITKTKERKTVTLAYFESTIKVTYPVGATLTCTNGSTTYTAPNTSGTHTFTVQKAGTWTIKAVKGSETSMDTVSITASGQSRTVALSFVKIYGIKRPIVSSSPAWTRTDDAVGKTAKASVGTVAGHSDFDNCYPWSEMKRETFSSGDVMVKIPTFYYKRYQEGTMEYMQIADKPTTGFEKHPGSDCYVGAYLSQLNATSKSGVHPHLEAYGARARANAKLKGKGWQLYDVAAMSAIQMLYLVEYANNDSQTVIGKGYTINVDSTGKVTGGADTTIGLTGVPTGESGKTNVVYRGVESLWGHLSVIIDGLMLSGEYNTGGWFYYSTDPSVYGGKPSTHTKTTVNIERAGNYVETLRCDKNASWILATSTIEKNKKVGSGSTHYCDGGQMCYQLDGKRYVLYAQGPSGRFGDQCGIFGSFIAYEIKGDSNTGETGYRIMYRKEN